MGIETGSIQQPQTAGPEAETASPSASANHTLTNSGALSVQAVTRTYVKHKMQAGFLQSKANGFSEVDAKVFGYGIHSPHEVMDLTNLHEITVGTIKGSDITDKTNIYAEAWTDDGGIKFGTDNDATITIVTGELHLAGVKAGDGASRIRNGARNEPGGKISVKVDFDTLTQESDFLLTAVSTAHTAGSGSDTNGRAETTATLSPSELYGIYGGSDGSTTHNFRGALIEVVAQPTLIADSKAFGGGGANIASQGEGTTTIHANDLKAYGIKAGDGTLHVSNLGTINVTVAPKLMALGYATAGLIAAHGQMTSVATANHATAIGIQVGDGTSRVDNSGTLNVTSSPHVKASAWGIGVTTGGATADATASATDATAIGILAGGDGHRVYNSGPINVTATPTVEYGGKQDVGNGATRSQAPAGRKSR